MIWRLMATAGAVLPVAAAAVAKTGATVTTSTPTIWFFLGYPFEAAGMIAALFGCISARFWIGAGEIARREHRWILDAPVSSMTIAVAAGLVISLHPEPLSALLYGGGVGILGEGVFKLAEQRIDKLKAAFGLGSQDKPTE
ncbi:MAG: hypothetical protein EON55_07650 [Alphaproteobacteria bacterium]|nr:MAG: hypothetical protein EON55_07650 [Alphaproteobacteria bacterium]